MEEVKEEVKAPEKALGEEAKADVKPAEEEKAGVKPATQAIISVAPA